MSALFDLEEELHRRGFDLNAMRTEWKKLSGAKGWPETAVGWERYCRRAIETDKGPRLSQETSRAKIIVPEGFVDWWKSHPHASIHPHTGVISPAANYAWMCRRYRGEYLELTHEDRKPDSPR